MNWGGLHNGGDWCGGIFDTDVGQMEEFWIIVICSCAKGETGFYFELDSLVTWSHHMVLCGCVVLYLDELFCFNQLSFLLLGTGGGGGVGEGYYVV